MSDYTPSLTDEQREAVLDWMELPTKPQVYEAVARMIDQVRAEAIRSARDELGVDAGDESGEWWDGYRQGQRRQFNVLAEYADRIEKEADQ